MTGRNRFIRQFTQYASNTQLPLPKLRPNSRLFSVFKVSDLAGSVAHLRFKLINALLFQLLWFVAVIFQNTGAAILVAAVVVHILLSPKPFADIRILALVAIPGFAFDSLLTFLGVFTFDREQAGSAVWAPLWLALLWCHFALYVQHGLFWLFRRPRWIAALFGAIAAPLSYFGAAKLGAVSFTEPWLAMTAVSVAWLLLFPVFISLATKDA